MNNIFVYLEIEDGKVADVSLELLTKGNSLAKELNCKLEALALGADLKSVPQQVFPYGVDVLHVFEDDRLSPYTTLPHTSVLINLLKRKTPNLFNGSYYYRSRPWAKSIFSIRKWLDSRLHLPEIGDHEDKRQNKVYENLLYQIRPAFGGNIVAWIINPDQRPQMATVRQGVMKKEFALNSKEGEVKEYKLDDFVSEEDFAVTVIERHIEKSKINIAGAPIIISGGYGVGSKENFDLLFDLASVIGAEVGASRAAVDAGYAEHDRQIGQTGITVRPKLYIACGISGQIQHIAGMQESAIIVAINNDKSAPINAIADYVITGDIETVVPKMIKYYKQNTK